VYFTGQLPRCLRAPALIVQRLQVLKPAGLCSIAAYLGHEEGRREYAMLTRLLAELDTGLYIVAEAALLNRLLAPRLLSVYRRPLAEPQD
jgi:hypothetical protein